MSLTYPNQGIVPSGVNITPAVSGLSNIGSSDYPFNYIYANEIVDTSGSSIYVEKAGDTMTGDLEISTPEAELKLTDGKYSRMFRSSGTDALSIYNQIAVIGGDSAGGTITHPGGGYTVHTFTEDGSFITVGTQNVEVLVVGGGGGGGLLGGGGGGGGVVHNTSLSVNGTISVTIGSGGAASAGTTTRGTSGGNSTFDVITAYGGSGGGSQSSAVSVSGGSTGGTMGGTPSAVTQGDSGGGTGYGNEGATGVSTAANSGGGGGGSDAAGIAGTSGPNAGGAGGAGKSFDISGAATNYAGGGGGGAQSGSGGLGGVGGGGNGTGNSAPAGAGTDGLGGGGGSAGYSGSYGTSGPGGKGIVIVRYIPANSTTEAMVFQSKNSTVSAEVGIATVGNDLGILHLNGKQIDFDINSTNEASITSNGYSGSVATLNTVNSSVVSGTTISGNNYTINTTATLSSGAYVDFFSGTVSNPSHSEGRVFYDSIDHTLAYYNDDANVTVNMGQELLARVRNDTVSTILNGQPVYVTGALGDRPTVALASASGLYISHVIGLATADIASGADGYVTVNGLIHNFPASNVNIVGPIAGDDVHLSVNDGELQTSGVSYPNFNVDIGTITRVAGPNIEVYVGERSHSRLALNGSNTLLGVNNAGTQQEYKSVSGTGIIDIVNTTGNISIQSNTPASTTANGISTWSGTTGAGLLNTSVTVSGGTLNASVISGTTISGNTIYQSGTDISDLYVNVSGDTISGDITLDTADILNSTSGVNNLGTTGLPFASVNSDTYNGYQPATTVLNEVPSGTINGTNAVFYLANSPFNSEIKLYENGIRMAPSGSYADFDYSLVTSGVTFVEAPASGSKILVDYFYI